MAPTPTTDILIAGAGIAGASLALALKRRLGALASVTVCDPDLAVSEKHPTLRAVAIAPDMQRWLDDLGIWPVLAAGAQPIERMVITDSRPGAQPNPAYLAFDAAAAGALACMVFTAPLHAALLSRCREAGVAFAGTRLLSFTPAPFGIIATDADGTRWPARLLVAADGANSRLRHAAAIQTTDRDYAQAGIVATLAHREPHGGCAIQHFLPGGPIALLPLRGTEAAPHRTSLVWTEAAPEATRLVALPEAAFLAALAARIGPDLGTLALVDRPQAFALRLKLARRMTAARFALLGDAARTIHPLAGQGLNLGLRDAAALAVAIATVMDLGLDPGGPGVLEAYARARQFDSAAMAAMTDGLNRLFSNDLLPLRFLRDVGLGLVDRAPRAKRLFIDNATGLPRAS